MLCINVTFKLPWNILNLEAHKEIPYSIYSYPE